jgi:hypothetical protein
METNINTIEDLLETLAGLTSSDNLKIESTDATIIHSIARQSFKGTALTDRQFLLMKDKLQKYKEQFTNCNFDLAIKTLRLPLRQIDRSKYITLIQAPLNEPKENWIKVRFPFSKKLIMTLQQIQYNHREYSHRKGSHEHHFLANEQNIFNVISAFKDKNFEIDQVLLEAYDTLLKLRKEDYVPSIRNMTLKNLHPNGVKSLEDSLGKLSKDNIVLYRDRSLMYGIKEFDFDINYCLPKYSTLTQKIVNREMSHIFINSTQCTLDQIVGSLIELERFPVVILLDDDDAFDHLIVSHNHFKNVVSNDQISVMMRLESNKSDGFNEYIKEHKLNSPVDKDTKIVYINRNKLNKPLLTSDCKPLTMLMLESYRLNMKMSHYADEYDLIIHYDSNISQFMRFEKNKIQEI